jgi:hypothetical protein
MLAAMCLGESERWKGVDVDALCVINAIIIILFVELSWFGANVTQIKDERGRDELE